MTQNDRKTSHQTLINRAAREQSLISHGGAIDLAAQKYGIPASEWLDLSTGINPLAYPIAPLDLAIWQRLPLASELDKLKAVARSYYGAPAPDHLVCAPGTQALIQTIPFWHKDHHGLDQVHILGPTYAEHAQCWQRAGHDCRVHETRPEDRVEFTRTLLETLPPQSVVILVNPNNPDGGLLSPDEVMGIARAAEDRECWLIVDEAFMDCQPDQSVCNNIDGFSKTIVLRSFGKFFGLAGARLGVAVMSPALAHDLENRIGPWAVPGPTIEIGCAALADQAWHQQTRDRLACDGQRLDTLITTNTSLNIAGATDLFRYYDGQESQDLANHLAKNGILVRRFDHDETKLRFGFPGDEADWQRLEKALLDWKAP